ncbi:MAG: hypothetical protein NTV73_12380 [Hyphomicrobiales bacterium]|nr:hypothetical protein [Hyphomicrobiales bacterium]
MPPAYIAQTNLQLYNQLLSQGRSVAELAQAKSAYDLASLIYSAHYQADGKPFICHTVGVASILSQCGLPIEVVAFGLIHNVYGNGDFADGRQHRSTRARRLRVRTAVGAEVEALVHRFRHFRITGNTIDRIEAELDSYDSFERHLVLTDLADHLEKYADDGVLYFGDSAWVRDDVVLYGERMIAIAERLGHGVLAEMMRQRFDAVAGRPLAPAILRPGDQKYPEMILPLSARKRLSTRLAAWRHRWRRGGK